MAGFFNVVPPLGIAARSGDAGYIGIVPVISIGADSGPPPTPSGAIGPVLRFDWLWDRWLDQK